MPIFVDAQLVARFVRRQRRILELARAWVVLPQVAESTAPLGVAKTLIEAGEENLATLERALS